MRIPLLLTAILALAGCASMPSSTTRTTPPAPWVPDLGDGTYKNPVLYADYSDPDVIRVGEDFYLTASSFTCVPGLPILHSRDLVNWTLIGHALPVQVPAEHFSSVRSGQGVWAPCFRYRDGEFIIYYPDPDFGIYRVTAKNPAGPWSAPVLVLGGKGLIDPTPVFDDDGRTWLIHGWARSRAGKNNILTLVPLNPAGTAATGPGRDIILGENFSYDAPDGRRGVTTLEGPKFFKLNGYYWIFAPVGGVESGPQAVFRSKTLEGPYEMRVVLERGGTDINGPHQGGLVDTPDGKQWWFMHFQQLGAYGRIVHLNPVAWREDGWPVMGHDPDGNGTGTPLRVFLKPNVGRIYPPAEPATSDDFSARALGLQWQWLANPQPGWFSLSARPGWMRLAAQPAQPSPVRQPSLLTQKIPAPAFQVTTKLDAAALAPGERAGLLVYGAPCAWIGAVKNADGALRVAQVVTRTTGQNEAAVGADTEAGSAPLAGDEVYLRLDWAAGARLQFSYSPDGENFTALGAPLTVAQVAGSWIGAKFGLFALAPANGAAPTGHADFDWVRVTAP